jgi:hypothetical protein
MYEITKLGLGEILLKHAVDDFLLGYIQGQQVKLQQRQFSLGLQSTRLSNQSRLYKLTSFIAFVVFFSNYYQFKVTNYS